MTTYVMLAVGLAVLALSGRMAIDRDRAWKGRAFFFILLFPLGAGATLAGVMRLSADQAIAPGPTERTLFAGVHYQRLVEPGEVVHVVRIRLGAPGLSFLVTPGDAAKLLPLPAKTPSEYLREHKLELGLAGARFAPGYVASPWEPPLASAAQVQPLGRTVARTVEYGKGDLPGTLYLTDKNEASIGHAPSSVYNAISGDCVLLGANANLADCAFADKRIARSAVGLADDNKVLVMVVVDGHLEGVARGVTASELAARVQALGLSQAVEMGVGPQAALVARDEDGEIRPLSQVVGEGRVGSERRVGAVLGVQAAPRIDAP